MSGTRRKGGAERVWRRDLDELWWYLAHHVNSNFNLLTSINRKSSAYQHRLLLSQRLHRLLRWIDGSVRIQDADFRKDVSSLLQLYPLTDALI